MSTHINPAQQMAAATIAAMIKAGVSYDEAEKKARGLFADLTETEWHQIRGGYEASEIINDQIHATCLYGVLTCCGFEHKTVNNFVSEEYPLADVEAACQILNTVLDKAKKIKADNE